MKNYNDWIQIQKAALPPVLALGGEEKAFVEEALLKIKEKILSEGLEDFNNEVLSGKSTSLDVVVSSANTLPMMASHRLVVVKDAESLAASELNALEIYLQSPCLTTLLVFIFDSIDARQKIIKLFEKANVCFKFDHPKEDEMLSLIRKRAKHYSLHCDDESALFLLMEVGTDLLMLDRAFEKLALACQDKNITVTDVVEQVSETRSIDAFILARAVAVGDRKKAVECMAKLNMAKEVPLRLLGMLAWQLRQVIKTRLLLDKGLSEQEISRHVSIFGDRLKPVLIAARKRNLATHISRLSRLYELDKELKSSRAPSWLWLERVVLQLCPKA